MRRSARSKSPSEHAQFSWHESPELDAARWIRGCGPPVLMVQFRSYDHHSIGYSSFAWMKREPSASPIRASL